MMHLNKEGTVMIVHCDAEKDTPTGRCLCSTDIPMNGLALPDPVARNHILDELNRQGWARVVAVEETGLKAYEICPCDIGNIGAWAPAVSLTMQ